MKCSFGMDVMNNPQKSISGDTVISCETTQTKWYRELNIRSLKLIVEPIQINKASSHVGRFGLLAL